MLSARSVMGMGGWSRIPRGGGASRRSQREACARWRRQPRRTLCAHVNTCDHGALGTGGMGTAAHAATRMVEHTAAGGQERTEGSVCAVSTCVRVGGHQGPTWQVLRRDTSRGWGWKPRSGAAAHPPHGPCLWAALLPLTDASHCGRLGDVVSTPSTWMEWIWQNDTEESRERSRNKEGDGETETGEAPGRVSDGDWRPRRQRQGRASGREDRSGGVGGRAEWRMGGEKGNKSQERREAMG